MSAMQLSIPPTLGLRRKDLGGNSWLGPMYRRFSYFGFSLDQLEFVFYSRFGCGLLCFICFSILYSFLLYTQKKKKEPGLHYVSTHSMGMRNMNL